MFQDLFGNILINCLVLHLCMKRAITDIQRVKTMTRITTSSDLSGGCFIGPVAKVDPDRARCPISVNS